MRTPLILAGALFMAAVAALVITASGSSGPITVSPVTGPAVKTDASHSPTVSTPSPAGPFAVYSPPPPTPMPRATPAPTPAIVTPQAPSSRGDEDDEEGDD
jgi:hypothetical protein